MNLFPVLFPRWNSAYPPSAPLQHNRSSYDSAEVYTKSHCDRNSILSSNQIQAFLEGEKTCRSRSLNVVVRLLHGRAVGTLKSRVYIYTKLAVTATIGGVIKDDAFVL